MRSLAGCYWPVVALVAYLTWSLQHPPADSLQPYINTPEIYLPWTTPFPANLNAYNRQFIWLNHLVGLVEFNWSLQEHSTRNDSDPTPITMEHRKSPLALETAQQFTLPQHDHSVLPTLSQVEGSLYALLDRASNTIRLLELMPDSCSDNLFHCKLVLASLNEKPRFNALSYMWGSSRPEDNEPQNQVWINGHPVSVRRNLLLALHVIRRSEHSKRLLWIDALCINQEDIQERGHQVSIMRYIYTQATEVLVWLGAAQEFPQDTAFNMVKRFSKYISQSAISNNQKASYLARHHLTTWKSLARICQLEYWNRLWIVQEIGLGSRLILFNGDETITWAIFSEFIEYISRVVYSGPLQNIRRHILDITESLPARLNKQKQHKNGGLRLEALLKVTEKSICREPRDKIYGLLGLASDVEDGEIKIDYSTPLFSVYEAVIWHRNKRYGDFAMVSFSELLQRILKGPLPLGDGAHQVIEIASTISQEQIPRTLPIKGVSIGPIRVFDAPWKEELLNEENRPIDASTLNDDSQLFLGPNGEVGFAPSSIQDDDFLCSFPGSRIMAICRSNEISNVLIGRAIICINKREIPYSGTESLISLNVTTATLQQLTRPILQSNIECLNKFLMRTISPNKPLGHHKICRARTEPTQATPA